MQWPHDRRPTFRDRTRFGSHWTPFSLRFVLLVLVLLLIILFGDSREPKRIMSRSTSTRRIQSSGLTAPRGGAASIALAACSASHQGHGLTFRTWIPFVSLHSGQADLVV